MAFVDCSLAFWTMANCTMYGYPMQNFNGLTDTTQVPFWNRVFRGNSERFQAQQLFSGLDALITSYCTYGASSIHSLVTDIAQVRIRYVMSTANQHM